MTALKPLHILVLATAVSPWVLIDYQWSRLFQCADTGNEFVLLGPDLRYDE